MFEVEFVRMAEAKRFRVGLGDLPPGTVIKVGGLSAAVGPEGHMWTEGTGVGSRGERRRVRRFIPRGTKVTITNNSGG